MLQHVGFSFGSTSEVTALASSTIASMVNRGYSMEAHKLNDYLGKEANNTLIMQFVHSCVNEISGYSGSSYQQFKNIGWTEEEYNYAHRIFSSLLRTPEVLYLDNTKMPQEYFDIPENVQNIILNCLKVREEELAEALTIDYSQKRVPTMVDFDWRLKMVMGSSKVALKESLLQLDLAIKDKDKDRILDIEMNREGLDSFIRVLESVKE